MAQSRSLDDQAREFAKKMSELLNGTVADGVRLTPRTLPDDTRMIFKGSRNKSKPDFIPISPLGKSFRVYLFLMYKYELSGNKEFLRVSFSKLSLYTVPEEIDDRLIISIEYTRNVQNKYPKAHLHVGGIHNSLDEAVNITGRKSRELRDLHFPVGGYHTSEIESVYFRPSLEDLIEFMVTEGMVEPRDNWKSVVDVHRKEWMSIQLEAAVRRSPEEAASALRSQGWTVEPPV